MLMSSKTIAVPPGEIIKEQLVVKGLSQKELAHKINMSEKHISKLINGEVMLTTEVAILLEPIFGLPASFWINFESLYREDIVKIKLENQIQKQQRKKRQMRITSQKIV